MSDGTLGDDGERCFSAAMRAIIVSVLPRPMGSAMIPPQNSGGSFSWDVCEMRLTKLESVRVRLFVRAGVRAVFPGYPQNL